MSNLLINKYEPKYLVDFNFSKDYIDYLNNIINYTNINILLLGNMGSGKTILLDAILFNYYGTKNINRIKNNVLYISSLKEQGVSFYKNDVKTFCQSTSEIYNKNKSIIIDNLDGLNDINQNIFKIHMDMYGKRVNFICSCTNLNKISSSILNHFFVIKIKSIDNKQLSYIIDKICKNEDYNISKELKDNIIKYSNNSVKLLINNLEKYRLLYDKIDYKIDNINNNILVKDLRDFYKYCIEKNREYAYNKLISIYDDGYSTTDIIEYMYTNLKLNNDFENDDENDFENDFENDIKYKIIQILSKYLLSINNTNEDELIIYYITNDIIDIIDI